jgi:hypothetical protein
VVFPRDALDDETPWSASRLSPLPVMRPPGKAIRLLDEDIRVIEAAIDGFYQRASWHMHARTFKTEVR